MKLKTLLLTIVCFLVVTLVNAKGNSDWQTFKKDNYKIQYPNDWRLVEVGDKHALFYIIAPSFGNNDAFNDNVNLVVEQLDEKNNTLAKFAKANERKVEHYVTDSEIISNETIGKKKKAFQRIEYTAPYPGSENARWVQYYFVKKDKCLHEFSTNYEDHLKAVQKYQLN